MTENTAPGRSRGDELTALLADVPKADDHAGVREYLHALACLGCAPLLIYPGSKMPADMRAPRQRSADDKAAQQTARDLGRRNWHRVKSPAGVHLATEDPAVIDGYLNQYAKLFGDGVAVNVAVSLGRSRLVVVDCDTRDQLAAFLAHAGAPDCTLPTVRTPGQLGPDGTMIHSDGGHFWFTLPDGVELPSLVGSLTDPAGGYAVMWGSGRYVLTPPSVRAEGLYSVTGSVHGLPDWLRVRITERAPAARQVADRSAVPALTTPIDEWSRAVSWAEILGPLDWTPTGRADGCGCQTWTAPGEHVSPKSATAHEPGCAETRYDADNPPLHIWTDHPGDPFADYIAERGTATLSKLQAVALIDFGNDMGATMDALGLVPDLSLDSDDELPGEGRSAGGAITLPPSFWDSRDSLRHIRDAAWSMLASPDATLAIALAKLSASVPPGVRVDTGVRRPMPTHTFAAPVGRSGGFKSSAMEAAETAVRFVPGWSTDPLKAPDGLLTPADDEPGELVFLALGGTGQGIIENFMGEVPVPLPEDARPNARQRVVRRQVRSNVLVSIDEGNGLAKALADPNSIVGETLRELWSGVTTGQGNAKIENRRGVRRGSYSFGMIAGFQLSVLARLLSAENVELGTPQRFLFAWTGAPDIPDEPVPFPGVLTVTIPADPITMCPELLGRVRAILLPLLRNAGTDNEADSQRVSVLVRLAALLAILDDRIEVAESDWSLAETIADTSRSIAWHALTLKRGKDTRERTFRRAEQVEDAIAVHTATAGNGAERAAVRIESAIRTEGDDGRRAKWTGDDGIRRGKFDSADRDDADAGLALLVDDRKKARLVSKGRTTYVELID